MQHKYVYTALLTAITGVILCEPLVAEIDHRQINEDNTVIYVSNEDWQPENFDKGTIIPAAHLFESGITVDGIDNEPQWGSAEEVTVPIYYGTVDTVSLKALYTDKEVFIRVRWADPTQDRDHHPWVWNTELENYETGPQVEDSVLLSFEAGCEWSPSFLEGYIYDFDAWHWMAARTDPVGQAIDVYGSMQDHDVKSQKFTEYKSRNDEDVWNLKFTDNQVDDLTLNWDELDRAYMMQPIVDTVYYRGDPDWDGTREYTKPLDAPASPPQDPTEIYPQFSPVKLEGGSAEVAAKGTWQDGYWTVEFRRDRFTPASTIYDTVFNRLVQFSVHVFDQVEAIDQAGESGRLFLRFLPNEKILVKD